jgi:hypothetical protein
MDTEPAHSISKRGRVGEGRPTLYTPELANRLADHIAAGLTDEEAAALENISCDCINRWRKLLPHALRGLRSKCMRAVLVRQNPHPSLMPAAFLD